MRVCVFSSVLRGCTLIFRLCGPRAVLPRGSEGKAGQSVAEQGEDDGGGGPLHRRVVFIGSDHLHLVLQSFYSHTLSRT